MPLTDTQIKAAQPGEKRRKLADGGGLTLAITPNGAKSWWFRIRADGRERDVTIGRYPDLSLKAARVKAAEMRAEMAHGKDPVVEARRAKTREDMGLAGSFKDLAEAYQRANKDRWSEGHAARFGHRMRLDVYPALGAMSPDAILPVDVAGVARAVEKRGAKDTGKRVAQMIGQVLMHGVALGVCKTNAAQGISAALGPAPATKHRPALLDPAELGAFLRAVDEWKYDTAARPLLWATLRTGARGGDLREMRWADLEGVLPGDNRLPVWTFATGKTGQQMQMPLSTQMVDLLRQQLARNGSRPWVFAGPNGKPLSDAAVPQFIDRLGYKGTMTGHGARAILRTVAVETLGHPEAAVEMHLGHDVRDIHGRAYNRTTWAPERRAMVQDFNDWLDRCRGA